MMAWRGIQGHHILHVLNNARPTPSRTDRFALVYKTKVPGKAYPLQVVLSTSSGKVISTYWKGEDDPKGAKPTRTPAGWSLVW
jgi:hypothetical protein